ncbi:hypothetical protein MPH_01700 [Macrophomina phaseolina MS6]|uniref:Uncharacterized protein n=1 Tax=Macrophomina phaseolina (strain MS6) TaxID=1126212 RepID=K2SWP3_MACPH|nr:hypothetical protein MPH_01700 [Macrophomina phaseolina MS6]
MRFKYPPATRSPLLPVQHSRRASSQGSGDPTSTSTSAQAVYNPPPQSQPRSQIEAMPPYVASSHSIAPPQSFAPPSGPLLQPRLSSTPLSQHYDISVRHPVFFSPALRKPPFPLPHAASEGVNPVAHGYVVENGANAAREMKTKL